MSKLSVTSPQAITVTPLRVIAYLRVSTDKQAEQGLGLDVQRKAIAAWARQHGHKIVAWHSDEGVSGASGFDPAANGLTTRPGLAAAFAALEAGQAGALAVYRLDRLSRKLANQEVWIERQEQAGRQVISVTEPGYGEDEMRTLVRQILGAVAEYERVVIVKRLQGGRAEKARQGGYAYGGPPYGWRAEGGELIPDPDEQAVIARARELRAAGCSLGAVADALNAGGTPARRGRWHAQTVARMLERPRSSAAAGAPRRQRSAPATQVPAPGPASAPKGRTASPGPAPVPATEPEPQPEPPAQHDHRSDLYDSERGQFPCGCSD